MRTTSDRSGRRTILAAVVAALTGIPASASPLVWDASGSSPTNPTDGPGQWSTGVADWSAGTTEVDWPSPGGAAVFGNNHGAAGSVLVASPVTVTGITFDAPSSGNYTIGGSNAITLAGPTPILTVNGAATNPTLSSPLVGNYGLGVTGTGVLTLGGNSAYSGATDVSSGTLVIASATAIGASSLNVAAGAVVDVNASTQLASGSLINSGTITIAAGQTLTTNYNGFNQTAGSLMINGSLNLPSASFQNLGGTITGTVTMTGGSGTVYFGPNATGGTFAFTGTQVYGSLYGSTSGINIPAGAVVTAAATAGSTTLNVYPTVNFGNLTVTSASGYNASLAVPSSFVNNGTITIGATGTPASAESLSYGFTNNGTVNVNASTQISTGAFVNAGTLNIAAGKTLTTSYNGFNQTGGSLVIGGALNLPSASFQDLGGTITGTVTMTGGSGTVYFGPNAPAGTFAFTGTQVYGSLYGSTSGINIPAGAVVTAAATAGSTTLNVYPTVNFGNLTVTSAAGYNASLSVPTTFTNNGIVTIGAIGTPASSESLSYGFTNNGTFNVNASTQISTGAFVNAGTLNIGAGQTLTTSYNGFNQTAGSLVINGSLNLPAASFQDLGGTITGTVTMTGGSGTVYFGPNAPAGTFAFTGTQVYGSLYGSTSGINIPAGAVVTAAATAGSTTLNVYPTVNFGNLTVTSASGYNASLAVPSSFVNNGTITIAAIGTPASVESLSYGFTNSGTFNVNASTQISTGAFVNAGTLNIAAGKTLTTSYNGFNQTAGSLVISGALNLPSASFQDLGGTITGTVTMTGGSGTVYFGPNAPAGTFAFTGTQVYGSLYGSTSGINIPAGAVITAAATAGSTTLNVYPTVNFGNLTVTSAAGYNASLSIPVGFSNHGTLTLASLGTPSSPDTVGTGFINAVNGTLGINASTKISGALVTAGTVNIAARQTLDLTAITPGLNISGGSISAYSSSATPATLLLNGIYWPTTSAATAASVTSDVVGTTASGRVDLNGNTAASIDIENPAATLTIDANVIDGGVNKSGPGTLVLGGDDTYTGATAVNAGTLVVTGSITSPTIAVAAGATLDLDGSAPNTVVSGAGTIGYGGASGATPHVVRVEFVTVPAGHVQALAAADNHAGRTLLVTQSIGLAGSTAGWTSTLDITTNDLDLSGQSLATVTSQVRQGYDLAGGGNWVGMGITSSSAAGDTSHVTAIGVIQNNQDGSPVYTASHPFDGYTPGASDVLVKYTDFGDSNLDGKVDGSDYTLIDAGYASHSTLTGWFNGDYNYDGVIDGSDYTLIDNAFNNQGVDLNTDALVATEASQPAAVPEPASALLMMPLMLLGFRRRG